MTEEVTNKDILDAMGVFSNSVEHRFSGLAAVIVTKNDLVEVRSDMRRLEQKVDSLINSVDGLAKLVKDYQDEHVVLHRRLEKLEAWAKRVSEQVGIPLPL